jgi:glutamine synthetase
LAELEGVTQKIVSKKKTDLKLNVVGKIPDVLWIIQIEIEPLAFTGNKFEFRAVGSNSNCSNDDYFER